MSTFESLAKSSMLSMMGLAAWHEVRATRPHRRRIRMSNMSYWAARLSFRGSGGTEIGVWNLWSDAEIDTWVPETKDLSSYEVSDLAHVCNRESVGEADELTPCGLVALRTSIFSPFPGQRPESFRSSLHAKQWLCAFRLTSIGIQGAEM
jgi:hypothetical protein